MDKIVDEFQNLETDENENERDINSDESDSDNDIPSEKGKDDAHFHSDSDYYLNNKYFRL